jgi:predicted ATPase/DNA-binding SARP family transcriptional activator
VALLGPVRVHDGDGSPIDIGGSRLRMLLARLALDAGRAVGTESLVDGLWGDDPPVDAANALQSLVSRLRKALREHAALDSTGGGYRLGLDPDGVDAHEFERLAARGRQELLSGKDAEAATTLGQALALWHGDALSDVLDAPFARAPAARLEDLRAGVAEDRFEAQLRLGRQLEVLPDLEAAAGRHPLRERLAGLRMRALYAAGRQSEALAVYDRIRATLAEELGVDPSEDLREIHLGVLRGDLAKPSRPQPQTQPDPRAASLPVRLTSFVGRDDELKLLAELLEGSRLVTLVGPGGAGKTRLATETAARHRAHDRGRVWFVALAGVRDPADVVGAVLGALASWDIRMRDTTHQQVDELDRVAELLDVGESVLVLDNCEHLVEAAAGLVHELLGRAPNLRVLATSREPLAITGETLCPVGPLEVPAGQPGVEEATGSAAVRLLIDRASTVRPGFAVDESTVDIVVEICRRLDGMPLALELAAARLRSMSPAQIARRLDDRFRLLTSGSRVALPRQRTLRAVVEWSWDLLGDEERALARRIAVFPGGATASSIEAVCAGGPLAAEDVLYVLGSLVEKSIVDVFGEDEPRYRMLETIRAYATERLEESGEQDAVYREFVAHFLALAEEYEPLLRRDEQLRAMAVFDAEHDTMVTALRRALDIEDAPVAARLICALTWYWVVRGFNEQFITFFGEAIQFEDRLPEETHVALVAMHILSESMPALPPEKQITEVVENCRRTNALERYPALAIGVPMLAFFSRVPGLIDEELARVAASRDPWVRACGQWMEGFVRSDRGDIEGAERANVEAFRLFGEVGDRWGMAMTMSMRAESSSLKGDHRTAIETFEKGLALATELGSDDDTAQQLSRLASMRAKSGDFAGAARDIAAAERVVGRGGNASMRIMVSFTALEVARRRGDFEDAYRRLADIEESIKVNTTLGRMAPEWTNSARAAILIDQGNTADGREALRTTLAAVLKRRDMPDIAEKAELAARMFQLDGDPVAAATALGLSESARGVFNRGDPVLVELVATLEETLGEESYLEAYRGGSTLSKEDALDRLSEMVGLPGTP